MRIQELVRDDDAVSPVIGVILMVAITVILAAVIASFVLGLGDTQGDVQPNSTFEFDFDSNDATLTITMTDGDEIDPSNLYLRGDVSGAGSGVDVDWSDSGLFGGSPSIGNFGSVNSVGGFDGTSELKSGQGIELVEGSSSASSVNDYDFNIVWETSDNSATLQSDSGPEA